MRRFSRWQRASFIFFLCLLLGMGQAASAKSQNVSNAAQDTEFKSFIAALWPRAQAKGVSAKIFTEAFAELTPDESLRARPDKQPEFDRPLQNYVEEAVSAARISIGRAKMQKHAALLAEIERRFGVPGEIIVSLWAIESDFGRIQGQKDMIRCLASLSFYQPDRPLFVDELLNALIILEEGKLQREKLRTSWAGAMGSPQFLPSTYLKYGVAFDGSGTADIWDNPADILASIANFLAHSGWKPQLPSGFEVTLPANFEFKSLHQSFAEFARQGLHTTAGHALAADEQATLFLPAGAKGPAFLLSDNYWVLKAYNNSDSYALSVVLLAGRIAGAAPLVAAWPKPEKELSHSQKIEMQRLLASLKLYQGPYDGRFGQASRDAIHAFQIWTKTSKADGYGTPELLDQLLKLTPR